MVHPHSISPHQIPPKTAAATPTMVPQAFTAVGIPTAAPTLPIGITVHVPVLVLGLPSRPTVGVSHVSTTHLPVTVAMLLTELNPVEVHVAVIRGPDADGSKGKARRREEKGGRDLVGVRTACSISSGEEVQVGHVAEGRGWGWLRMRVWSRNGEDGGGVEKEEGGEEDGNGVLAGHCFQTKRLERLEEGGY